MAEKGIVQTHQDTEAGLVADSAMPRRLLCIASDTNELWVRKEDGTILKFAGGDFLPKASPRFTGTFGNDSWASAAIRPAVVAANGDLTPSDAATLATLLAGTVLNLNKLQIGGVDRVTAAGGFVGTSLNISGVTTLATSLNGLLKATAGVVGAAASGTDFLAPSNVSGTAGQVAVFSATTSVSSWANIAAVVDAVNTNFNLGSNVGYASLRLSANTSSDAEIRFLSNSVHRARIRLRASGARLLIGAQDAAGADIDAPLEIFNDAGGAINAGGNGRPFNLTSGSKLQVAGVDAITSARAGNLTSAIIAGLVLQNDPSLPSVYSNIYGDGVTPTDSNWSLSVARNGAGAFLNGSTSVGLTVANTAKVTAYSDRVNIAVKLQIAGVDRITAAGGFVGTSLQISGATASKLARFDASKNLVSYDLTASDITTALTYTPASANSSTGRIPKLASSNSYTDSLLTDNGVAVILTSGQFEAPKIIFDKLKGGVESKSGNFALGDCSKRVTYASTPASVITLSGGDDGQDWWLGSHSSSISVPSGVTLRGFQTLLVGPTTYSWGGGKTLHIVKFSSTEYWCAVQTL